MIYRIVTTGVLALGLGMGANVVSAQRQPHTFFTDKLNLSDSDIQKMEQGQIVTKVLESGDPKYGILVFGGIYINAPIPQFASTYRDVNKLLEDRVYLDIQEFQMVGSPPKPADFVRLTIDHKDVDALEHCKPEDCDLQVFNVEAYQKQIDWKSSDKYEQANKLLRERLYEAMTKYHAGGLQALGSYADRKNPYNLSQHMASMLGGSYYLPQGKSGGIYSHVINFPQDRVPGAEDFFYWENINFGEGPTIRINHVAMFPKGYGASKFIIANEQLYASRYIRLALQVFYCVPDTQNPNKPGFFLIEMNDSRLPDFGGFKLSVVRRIATDKAVEGTHDTLALYQKRLTTK